MPEIPTNRLSRYFESGRPVGIVVGYWIALYLTWTGLGWVSIHTDWTRSVQALFTLSVGFALWTVAMKLLNRQLRDRVAKSILNLSKVGVVWLFMGALYYDSIQALSRMGVSAPMLQDPGFGLVVVFLAVGLWRVVFGFRTNLANGDRQIKPRKATPAKPIKSGPRNADLNQTADDGSRWEEG